MVSWCCPGEPILAPASRFNCATHDAGQLRVGRPVVELPIFADQFVAELGPPRLQGSASGIIRADPAGPHEQQRVGFAGAAGIECVLPEQVFACRPQRRGQRVAGPHRPVEVGLAEHDLLRL